MPSLNYLEFQVFFKFEFLFLGQSKKGVAACRRFWRTFSNDDCEHVAKYLTSCHIGLGFRVETRHPDHLKLKFDSWYSHFLLYQCLVPSGLNLWQVCVHGLR